MNGPEITNQVVEEVQKQQQTIGQTVADVGGTVVDIGSEVAAEGVVDIAIDGAFGVGETILGGAGELLGGIFDGI